MYPCLSSMAQALPKLGTVTCIGWLVGFTKSTSGFSLTNNIDLSINNCIPQRRKCFSLVYAIGLCIDTFIFLILTLLTIHFLSFHKELLEHSILEVYRLRLVDKWFLGNRISDTWKLNGQLVMINTMIWAATLAIMRISSE